jgi:putative ABC transport system permease protein
MNTDVLTQCMTVCRLSLLSLRLRWSSSVVIFIGMTCVVGVLLSMLSMTAGMLRASQLDGDSTHVILLPTESGSEFGTGIPRSSVATLLDGPGIAREASGRPLIDGEFLFWVPPTEGFTGGSLYLRGIGAAGIALRPRFRVVAGRLFSPGRQEVIVGKNAERLFDLPLGGSVIMPGGAWPIVGVFSNGGGLLESQLMADGETVMSAARLSSFGSVLVGLKTPADFEPFKKWVANKPELAVNIERQSAYYVRTADETTAFFTAVALAVGGIMTLGALFGSLRILYTTVSLRRFEIATLRAIGYQALAVASSVVLEALVLSLTGALAGAWLAWCLFDGRHVAYFRNVFDLSVTPGLLELGIIWSIVVALIGAVLPALRAARLPVAEALCLL